MRMHFTYTGTGAAAIAASLAPKDCFNIEQVTLHLSAAPTTSENLAFTINALAGAAYDTVVFSVDLSASSTTNLVWVPSDGPLRLVKGDSFDVAFANTDTGTYGLQIYYSLR
jgi:hypothetical protein